MRYAKGKNPNSLRNLKVGGPGRNKIMPEEKIIKKAIMEYLKEYLDSGGGVSDFLKIRERKPEVALNIALERTYGSVPKHTEGNSSANINMLIQVLTGKTMEDNQNKIEEIK